MSLFEPETRAGSGHFFYSPCRVWAGRFWPGSGSGRPFLASGEFGPAFFGLGQVRAGLFWPRASSGRRFWPIFAHFWPIFQLKMHFFWFGLGRATQNLVRAGSGHPKSGPGRVTQNPWPDPALQKNIGRNINVSYDRLVHFLGFKDLQINFVAFLRTDPEKKWPTWVTKRNQKMQIKFLN